LTTGLPDVHFACNLGECKGACCTLNGGRGAPVTDEEVDEIYNAYPVVKKYLPKEHTEWIERHGLVEGAPGYYATQCKDEQACVFVYYDDGIAKCSFEKGFHNKEIQWRKPLSCHLFPLRTSYGTPEQLRFEYLHECEPASKKGSREKFPLFKFFERCSGPRRTDEHGISGSRPNVKSVHVILKEAIRIYATNLTAATAASKTHTAAKSSILSYSSSPP